MPVRPPEGGNTDPDPIEDVARLIAELGACYQRGRRYQALETPFEERYLAPALEIGAEVRRAARHDEVDSARLTVLTAELRALLASCQLGIDEVRAGEPYRRAATAWAEGRWLEVADLAPQLFTSVEPYRPCPLLYHPVAIASRRGGRDHFISPEACADTIAKLATNGIPLASPPPALGADDTIGAVVLEDDPDLAESPISLVVDPQALGIPVCRLVPNGDALVYVPRLHAPCRIRVADIVTDEWWAVTPDAYRRYLEHLSTELEKRGLPPPTSS